jgi:hypothetical protein
VIWGKTTTEGRSAERAVHGAVRAGVYVGLALTSIFTAWVILANRAPFLEPFFRERNLAATAILGLLGLLPILRYRGAPRLLALCGLVGWTMLSFVYRLLCIFFTGLGGIRTPTEVLMFGVLFYLIAATVAWMASLVWRVRQSASRETHAHR